MTLDHRLPEAADRNVRMSPELMDALFTRDELGRRLRMEWGEPGEDGFYEPTITTDFSDDLVEAERHRILVAVSEQHYRYHGPLQGCVLPCPFPAILAAVDGRLR